MAGAGVILALAAAISVSFGSPAWGALAVIVLVAALNRFFFPSRFTIDDQGITARFPLRRQRCRWADLRRYAVDRHGCYLSTRAKRSRLDAYRGMHVLFGRHRDAVMEGIHAHLREGPGA